MATAGVNRMMLWTDLEGREVGGRWKLNRLVRPEGRLAWFEAARLDGTAVMLSVVETLNDEDELLTRLQAAAKVHHPNVVAVGEAMVSRLDETPVVVAETERTDENLGDVLRDRTLAPAEARQVLEALLAGLAAIHAAQLVHGRMEASSVLAIGETIKLRSDCLRIGGTDFAAEASEDVRGVGRIVTQAVTRRLPTGENDPVLQLLPEPLARAVRRALSGNATAAEVATLAGTRLELLPDSPRKAAAPVERPETPKEPPAAVVAAPSATATVASETASQEIETPKIEKSAARVIPMKRAEVSAEPVKAEPEKTVPPPVAVAAPQFSPAPQPSPGGLDELDDEDLEAEEGRKRTRFLFAACLAFVVIVAFLMYGVLRRSATRPPAPAAPPPASTAAAPVSSETANPSAAAAGTATAPTSAPAPSAAATAAGGWRVVVYTYHRQDQAEHKVATLARRFSQLQPGVYPTRGGATYLVTLGGSMSRAEAFRLRDQAVRMGLPRDTYAQNFH